MSEDADRLIRHSARARQTLASFKREVVSHHVHRLQTLILEGLNELLRKADLIVDVSIDPDTRAYPINIVGLSKTVDFAPRDHLRRPSPSHLTIIRSKTV